MYSLAYGAMSVPSPVTNSIHNSVSLSTYSEKLAMNCPSPRGDFQCRLNHSSRLMLSGVCSYMRERPTVTPNAPPRQATVIHAGILLRTRRAAHTPQRISEITGSQMIQPAQDGPAMEGMIG